MPEGPRWILTNSKMNHFIEVITVSKAKTDVDKVFKQLGYHNLTPMHKSVNPVSRFIIKLCGVARILTSVHRGDNLCLQYPMKKFYHLACTLAHLKGAKVITIVHDLDAFRRKKITAERERYLFNKTDALIVHNPTMLEYMKGEQFQGRLYNLQIFDFITEAVPKQYVAPHTPWRVVYTSNLRRWRNEFIYHLDEVMHNWNIVLFGPGYEDAGAQKPGVTYMGKLPEEKLICSVEGDFGLVWDGDSFDECAGDWGEYLKINNPHKTSLYLRAGIPVIVWKKAALAPFITENQLGIAVDSIRDLDQALADLTPTAYAAMKANALEMSEKLGDGFFEKKAFTTATANLEKAR